MMIRVIYRWQVISGLEEKFVAAWTHGTKVIRETIKEAQGSVLLRNREKPSEFIAIARWDNFEAWQDFCKAESPAPKAFQLASEVSTLVSTEVCDEFQDLVFHTEKYADR